MHISEKFLIHLCEQWQKSHINKENWTPKLENHAYSLGKYRRWNKLRILQHRIQSLHKNFLICEEKAYLTLKSLN